MTISPEQFNKIAMKEDLEKFYTKAEMDDKFDKVLTAIDGLAKKVDNISHEFVSNQVAHDRFETRITKLETVVLD